MNMPEWSREKMLARSVRDIQLLPRMSHVQYL